MNDTEITIRRATLTVNHGEEEVITSDDIESIYEGGDDLLPLFRHHDALMAEIVGEVNYQLRMEREADAPDDSEMWLDNRDRAQACRGAF